jgi:hypothetical protein
MQLIIQNIKTALIAIFGHFPAITRILEQILVEIAYSVVVRLVNLSNTLTLNRLAHRLPVYLRIERQFYGVDDILVEFTKIDTPSVLSNRILNVIEDVFIRNKA